MASARARQLLAGSLPRVESGSKVARTAEREVLAGAVGAVEPEAAVPGEKSEPGA